jgi:hypothetical protein
MQAPARSTLCLVKRRPAAAVAGRCVRGSAVPAQRASDSGQSGRAQRAGERLEAIVWRRHIRPARGIASSRQSRPGLDLGRRAVRLCVGAGGADAVITSARPGCQGAQSKAVRFYSDEVLISEGDLVGKTREAIRSLHFRRDRDWLQS